MNQEFTVTGAKVLFEIPVLGGIAITETVVNTWIVMAVIVGLCLFMTSGLQVHCRTRRQVVAEFIVTKVNAMVGENMGEHFLNVGYAPLIATIMGLSALCSLSGMVGLFAPTSDLSTLLAWSLVVNTWIVMAVIVGLCLFMTSGLQVHCRTRRQIVAEFIVTKVNAMVGENMGEHFLDVGYAPLIATIMGLSALCSLSGMVGLFAPTSDLSTLLAWSLVVFVLITYNKFRAGGPVGYIKGYFQPIPVLLPFNIISEFATPLSMAFRHFGNIASGTVIMGLLRWALANLSFLIFSKLPGVLGQVFGQIPLLQVGIPAVFSIYFDIFSSLLQAFIFCMLTMMYIGSAAEE